MGSAPRAPAPVLPPPPPAPAATEVEEPEQRRKRNGKGLESLRIPLNSTGLSGGPRLGL